MLLCDYIDGAILLEYYDDFYVVTIEWYDFYIGYRMKETYSCFLDLWHWFMLIKSHMNSLIHIIIFNISSQT